MGKTNIVERGWVYYYYASQFVTLTVHTLRARDRSRVAWWDAYEHANGQLLDAYDKGKAWPTEGWAAC